jgi:hypothetical protein
MREAFHPTPGDFEKALYLGLVDDFVEHAALAERQIRADLRCIGLERSPHPARLSLNGTNNC